MNAVDVPRKSRPVAGPLFREAARLPLGAKRKRLFALLCAYADAGVTLPSISPLVERLGYPPAKVDGLAAALAEDGLLEPVPRALRRRDGLRYRLPADRPTDSSRAKGAGR